MAKLNRGRTPSIRIAEVSLSPSLRPIAAPTEAMLASRLSRHRRFSIASRASSASLAGRMSSRRRGRPRQTPRPSRVLRQTLTRGRRLRRAVQHLHHRRGASSADRRGQRRLRRAHEQRGERDHLPGRHRARNGLRLERAAERDHRNARRDDADRRDGRDGERRRAPAMASAPARDEDRRDARPRPLV